MSVNQGITLKVENIHKTYGREKVLQGISFEVKKGETKVIIGPSGTGKSTLLRCVNRLTIPDAGRIWLDGTEITHPRTDINKVRQSIGMVFQ
ncbi:amino acid ABC transporter ATP-binding protein, partial [Candidatus Aerophobetes bacterium]|nr:amino acid ABC transporter ATP-binding protein [Candidatus Aerophobetes bacterium]